MPNLISNLANEYAYKRDVSKAESGSPATRIESSSTEEDKNRVELSEQASAIDSKALALNVENLTQIVRRDLEFSIDKDSGTQVMRVVDAETGELVRQIPPEQILQVISRIEEMRDEMLPGVLLDDRV
jgi:flagellar protein FlaG